jgi:nucleoside-diphosphate-sugar epimerase
MKRKILVTGAAGKVGQNFIDYFKTNKMFEGDTVVAFCHNRVIKEEKNITVFQGNIAEQASVEKAMLGITHVVHLATCKESPEIIIDITVKGLFWLLEESRKSPTFKQFILLGGDAAIGHCVYPYDKPQTETDPFRPYPGCYALSKVLEETLLQQYYIQYNLNGCCLRAPWIMEKDDFRKSLSFGDDVFGGPKAKDFVSKEIAKKYADKNVVPIISDKNGKAIKRNFVHVSDLVNAIGLAFDNPQANQQLFHICMSRPVDYQELADYVKKSQGFDSVKIETDCHSTWMDNSKAKLFLNWEPKYNLEKLVDDSYNYKRSATDPRVIYYQG